MIRRLGHSTRSFAGGAPGAGTLATSVRETELKWFQFACSLMNRPAMIVQTDTFELVCTNTLLERMSGASLPFTIGKNFLEFDLPGDRLRITSELHANKEYGSISASIAFPGQHGVPVLLLTARHIAWPLRESRDGHDRGPGLALIELMSTDYVPDLTTFSALADEFRLSSAERHDLMRLAMGFCIAEMAGQDNVAESTTRQRLKTILSKTRCSRQQELICLVRSLCPPRTSWC